LMHGKHYMITTTWNAPETAFTLPGEFFNQVPVDDGILYGFHKAMDFTGMKRIEGYHFHDLEKNATPERISGYHDKYQAHLVKVLDQAF